MKAVHVNACIVGGGPAGMMLGVLLIGDAAHTMSPAGAIGVNVAIALVAAQEIYPRLGRGPIAHADLRRIQQVREPDVRTLHRLQLAAQTLLLGQDRRHPIVQWLLPKLLPIVLHTPIMPSIQRRIFFGAPLPPIDPAFTFAH